MAFLFLTNFSAGINQVLMTPMILGFASGSALGIILTASGLGGIAGSVLLSMYGGPSNNAAGMLVGCMAQVGLDDLFPVGVSCVSALRVSF